MTAMRKALRYWPWLAAIFSGLLCTFCFPPFNQAWLCWFALTPLLAAVWFSGTDSKRRWLRDLNLGYLAGLVFLVRFLLVKDRHGKWLDSRRILHGGLFCGLGLARWIISAAQPIASSSQKQTRLASASA